MHGQKYHLNLILRNYECIFTLIILHRAEFAVGDTPLHISFQCGLADELILLFIWSNPHAVLMANAKGELPLHSACEQTGISRCIIEALIQYDHSQLYTKDENENTALMITWNKLLEHEKCRDDIPDSHPHELQNEARSFFDTLSILLMVSGMCMDGGDKTLMYDMQPYNILRSAIKCNKIYPLSLIKYLVKSYPSLMNIRDEAGQLPLHLSCQIHDINCPVIGENSDDDTANQSRVYIVSCMVEAFPNAARVNDCTGRYPIHYALSAGYKWNDGLKQIFFAAPELVSSRDKRTGLFPFMLAAADECQCIDSIFILLRREPDLIRAQRCETAEMYE